MHVKSAFLVFIVTLGLDTFMAAAALPARRDVVVGSKPGVRKPEWPSKPTMNDYWKESAVDNRAFHGVLAGRISKRLIHPKKVLHVLVVGARAVTRCVINKCRDDWTYDPPIPNDRVKPVKVLPPQRRRVSLLWAPTDGGTEQQR